MQVEMHPVRRPQHTRRCTEGVPSPFLRAAHGTHRPASTAGERSQTLSAGIRLQIGRAASLVVSCASWQAQTRCNGGTPGEASQATSLSRVLRGAGPPGEYRSGPTCGSGVSTRKRLKEEGVTSSGLSP